MPVGLRFRLDPRCPLTRRVSASALYWTFVPLAMVVAWSHGAFADQRLLALVASASALAQASAVLCWRDLPDWAWGVLVAAVPATFAGFAIASASAGTAMAPLLVVPVAWTAVFLSRRQALVSTGLHAAAMLALLPHDDPAASAIRVLALVVVAAGAHLLVTSLVAFREEAEQRGSIDPVTRTWNRRYMTRLLDEELAVTHMSVVCPGVLVIDIDHFKRVNDRHGHRVGDDVLREVAARLRGCVGVNDTVARWGGEEFVVLLPTVGTDQQLESTAERARRVIAGAPFTTDHGPVDITISIGAARARPALRTVDALLDAADRALYAAKRGGRNRVAVNRPLHLAAA